MELKELLRKIVKNSEYHAKWINSLSMMENVGARKISASEHPQKVDLIVLKHAAEEARHAYYLKKQIEKLDYNGCVDYSFDEILAPIQSSQYLNQLDVQVSRYLKEKLSLNGYELQFAAYLLVTYAIEVRADALYPEYQDVLSEIKSNISVKFIIAEEKGHLEEMVSQLENFFSDWEEHAKMATDVEKSLFEKWIVQLEKVLA